MAEIVTPVGRIVPLPKGAYDENTTYQKLDFVTYNGSSYVAITETKGNLPTNVNFWQIMAQATSGTMIVSDEYVSNVHGNTLFTPYHHYNTGTKEDTYGGVLVESQIDPSEIGKQDIFFVEADVLLYRSMGGVTIEKFRIDGTNRIAFHYNSGCYIEIDIFNLTGNSFSYIGQSQNIIGFRYRVRDQDETAYIYRVDVRLRRIIH